MFQCPQRAQFIPAVGNLHRVRVCRELSDLIKYLSPKRWGQIRVLLVTRDHPRHTNGDFQVLRD